MDILRQADLRELIESAAEWCISLYMPTHRAGQEQQQDPIRFRNLLSEAKQKLLAHGLRQPDADEFLAPLEKYSQDRDFWHHQSDGLAIFLAPDVLKIYRLPSAFEKLLVVASYFHIKPLIPLLSKNEKFYLLALSLNKIRLFQGSKENIDEVELDNLPTGLKSALKMDEPEKYLGYHTGASSPGRQGMRRAVYHGHGGKPDSRKKDILQFFQRFDREINKYLDEKNIPLVLAGVDYLLPIYHQANKYPRLISEGLEGNPDLIDLKSLHQLAWEIVEPLFKTDQVVALDQLTQMLGTHSNQAISGLETVLKATHAGKVETLFLPKGVHIWGHFDPQNGRVTLETESTQGNDELLSLAAMCTVFYAGKIFVVAPQKLPSGEPAALLRYTA